MMKIQEFIAYLQTGDDFVEKKDYENALKQYNQAIDLDPTNDEAYFKRANVYTALNKLHLAIKDYTKAALANPREPKHLHFRALSFQRMNKPAKAITDFGRAITINKENYRSYYQRGNVSLSLGNFHGAVFDYSYALVILKKHIAKYNLSADSPISNYMYNILEKRGIAFSKMRKFKVAIADFDNQLIINSTNFAPYFNKGDAYENLGMFEVSIENFFRAGCITLEQKDQELQLNCFERIVALSSDQDNITNEIVLAGIKYYQLTHDKTVIKNFLTKNLKKVDKALKQVLFAVNDYLNDSLSPEQFHNCIQDQLTKVKKHKAKNIANSWPLFLVELLN